MYRKDAHGEYRMTARWIDAWDNAGRHRFAGWCVCEVRSYTDGAMRVHREEPIYLNSASTNSGSLHAVYLIAARALGA